MKFMKFLALMFCCTSSIAMANIYNSVSLVDDDGEYALYQTHDENYFFMHARHHNSFVSMSIPTMYQTSKAGYALIPANDLQQMSDNADKSKVYSADCMKETVIDERGRIYSIQNLSELHQTAFATSCNLFSQL